METILLHDFIDAHRNDIIDRCSAKVAARSNPPRTALAIEHGVPVFLNQLLNVLRLRLLTSPEIRTTALLYGHDLLVQGFSVCEVVHDYGDVCQSVTELAVELDATISADDFRILNGCLDNAIAGAVTEYGREKNQSGINETPAFGRGRPDVVIYELRRLNQIALVAFEAIRAGRVGVTGATGTVLHQTLTGIENLLAHQINEVRLPHGEVVARPRVQ